MCVAPGTTRGTEPRPDKQTNRGAVELPVLQTRPRFTHARGCMDLWIFGFQPVRPFHPELRTFEASGPGISWG